MTQTMIRRPSATTTKVQRETFGHTWLALGLFFLGAGAALVAVLGPLVTDIIRYHASEGAVNQIVGGDIAGLLLAAPVSILAGILVWRGHLAGPVLALGPSGYALYTYSQLALAGDFVRYPGNSERFFPLYLGLFVLAGVIAIRAWKVIPKDRLPGTKPWVHRSLGIFFLVMAAFLTLGLHFPGLVDAWADQPTSIEYLADPAVFWLVKFMDLGIVVPGMALAGIGILRGSPWAERIKYGAVGWAGLMGASVAGMAIVMQATSDPAATTANTIAFSTFAAIAIGIGWIVYRPLFRANGGPGAQPTHGDTKPGDRTQSNLIGDDRVVATIERTGGP